MADHPAFRNFLAGVVALAVSVPVVLVGLVALAASVLAVSVSVLVELVVLVLGLVAS